MDTLIQSLQTNIASKAQTTVTTHVNDNPFLVFWEKIELARFGVTPLILLVVVIIGAISAAIVLQESAFKLAIVAIGTSSVQAMIIAVMPMRLITYAAIISIIVNLMVIAF